MGNTTWYKVGLFVEKNDGAWDVWAIKINKSSHAWYFVVQFF
jgi:hypothetical protein